MITGPFIYDKFLFPCGEPHVRTDGVLPSVVDLTFEWENEISEVFDLLLICDAIKRQRRKLGTLTLPYIPFSRQDRVGLIGEPLSLDVFTELINRLGFKEVIVTDPHSDVSTAFIENVFVVEQHHLFAPMVGDRSDFYLVSPDGGALKKIYKLAKETRTKGVIECSKQRELSTGKITGTIVHMPESYKGETCIIVDDICDGGATFVEIAKKLKEYKPERIILMVSHGFFTKGLGVFDGLIDEIYTRKGRVL